jgi:hypothetical protein
LTGSRSSAAAALAKAKPIAVRRMSPVFIPM